MDNKNLTKAFQALRKKGYFAKQNFWCCSSCGWFGVPKDNEKKVVFYHNQDNDDKKKGKPFHIAWAGDANEIMETFKENGVETSWTGSPAQRILIVSW
jgi:hypothetical protein